MRADGPNPLSAVGRYTPDETAAFRDGLSFPGDDFAGIFSTIDFSGGVVAAVSGGSDSTALLLFLKSHLDHAAPGTKLLAVTVDHRLRDESAGEAAAVAALCAKHGIAHRIMAWDGAKPLSGLPAAAREARYSLLAEAARDAGIGMIMTGHTADDQAETVLMRQKRAQEHAEGRGLAGMAPSTLYGRKIWILRPLLGIRRETLRKWLREQGTGWMDDPTNADRRFERPQIRATLQSSVGEQRGADALEIAADAARRRVEIGRRSAGLISSLAITPSPGLIRLDPEFAAVPDRQAAVHALRILLAVTGGVPFLADESRALALFDRLGTDRFRATLSRSVIDRRSSGIFLYRESRGLPEPTSFAGWLIWDGRRRIDAVGAASVVAPFGRQAAASHEADGEPDVPASVVRAALAAEPALWTGNPGTGNQRPVLAPAQAVVAPWALFLPAFDLAPACAVAALLGAPSFPVPPWPEHNGSRPSAKA